nr:SIMPL domain-containing protein [uncultured Albidiferax sp.]
MPIFSRFATKVIASSALLICASSGFSQESSTPQPLRNVVQLAASGAVEVQQDLLTVVLATSRDGNDAGVVQTQLKLALDAALTEARKAAQTGQLDVRTGNFSLYPRYNKDGKIQGWQGTTELVLEGRDFARIASTAGKIPSLTLGNVSFSLSRAQRAQVEGQAQAIAIEQFKAKASDIAKGFGFAGYSLREISVNANDVGGMPRPRAMAMEAKMASADMAVPVEAGRSTVQVTVSGAVQLTSP